MTGKFVKELPRANHGNYERKPNAAHIKIVKALHKKPYEWMKVREFNSVPSASRFARQIREGQFLAFRDGQYEAKSVKGWVYVRYMGS